jgi:hypothetical protein
LVIKLKKKKRIERYIMEPLKNKLSLCVLDKNQTIVFAAEELAKYLLRISQKYEFINFYNGSKYEPDKKGILWIGLSDGFGIQSTVQDVVMDDMIYLDVTDGCGIISGINPRSVLLAVYRFLTEAGCRWVRPGIEGECIPQTNITDINIKVSEKPSYRHRGICLEGAASYENVADIIDWAPKVSFNAYFIQLKDAYAMFKRWYSHSNNPLLQSEPFTVDKAREYTTKLENEIKKRGMLYHAAGHGWTCEPFGITGNAWDQAIDSETPSDARQYLALINGKREIFNKDGLDTNLCYSNEKVRSIVVNHIADYLEKHKAVDILHFWLADGYNNHCECDECKKMLPSDYYVTMLNKLDEILTSKGIGTKIVFCIYLDLSWVPQKQRIKNPDRFIMMYAPITRSFTEALTVKNEILETPPYDRNKLVFPFSYEPGTAFLRKWQSEFKGDSFDFDYHFMWDHYIDPGYSRITRVLSEDIKLLKYMGLNGFVSCQLQRVYFPTGLGMYVMGRTLWDNKLDFDSIADEYFESSFGPDGFLCREYMEQLSELFDMEYMTGKKPFISEESTERFIKILEVVNRFKPVIDGNMQNKNGCIALSWSYLKYHADICYLLALGMHANSCGNKEMVDLFWDTIERYVQKNEMALQPVLDVFEFIKVMKDKFKKIQEHAASNNI